MTEGDFIILCNNLDLGYEIEVEFRERFVDTIRVVFARLTPQQKLIIFDYDTLQ